AACGYSSDELEDMLAGLDLTSLLYDRQRDAKSPPGEEGTASALSIFRLEFNERGHITGPLGGLSGKKLLERLQEWTARWPVLDFADLPVSFAAVATDLVTGEPVVLRRGNLASAMRASMAIPGLFSPWNVDGRLLVDGGLVSNAPVLVARELFPGYPVIAVDVSGKARNREDIRTVVDVMDQMISIMTMRNVQEELKHADLVVTPDVGGLPMLDVAGHEEIIKSGEIAARRNIEQIISVASKMTPHNPSRGPQRYIVAEVRTTGLGENLSKAVIDRYDLWVGREADPEAIIQACVDLRQRDDVRAADFSLEYLPDGRAAVVLNVEKEPAWEVVAGGYASNLNPYAAVYLDTVRRDLFSEGDSFRTRFGISERWHFSARYLSPVEEGYGRWEANIKGGKRIYSPQASAALEWEQYSASLRRHYGDGPFRASLGFAIQETRFGGQNNSYSGPLLSLACEGLDDPIDPTEGFSASLSLWWPDTGELLGRMRFFGVSTTGNDWRFYIRGGAIMGDGNRAWHSAYLGAREELYSRGASPLRSSNAAWAGIGIRRVFLKSWWGTINLDLFATAGRSYDASWRGIDDIWEAGIAVSLPGKMFDGKVLVMYDDRSDWSFGFTLGRPLWDNDPLP
ncbi:MAG TPA: hypothetical protein ENN89_01885, partial [Synergistetes bacterium]|nr:hypothetical protein [Synergistota bacterium]